MRLVPIYSQDLNSNAMMSGVAGSWTLDIPTAEDLSVQINTTKRSSAPFTATFSLSGSNDLTNYAPVSGFISHTNDSENLIWRVTDPDFSRMKVAYENVSGSGLVEIYPFVKSIL